MRVYVQEVGMRDGLQIEDRYVPTEKKIDLIDRLSQTGLDKIEVTSFVSPKAVPNLKDAGEVMSGIKRDSSVTYTALVPNPKGAERALACHVDEINLVVSVSETHNRKNVNASVDESFERFQQIASLMANSDTRMNGTLGTSFGCPYEGEISEDQVLRLTEKYLELGATGITLADTTGMAVPNQVYSLCQKVLKHWPELPLTLHLHNTRGAGLANVIEGIRAGVDRYDASLGGIGGCPFAPGATGNICTEDFAHMLTFMGYDLRVDVDQLIACSQSLQDLIGHEVPGQVIKAGQITDLYPIS